MIRRIFNKITFLLLQFRISPYKGLKKIKPFDQLNLEIIEQHKKEFKSYYEQYVNEISRADMAASLELSSLVYTLCQNTSAKKTLDMGSGFSSFILRTYAAKNPGSTVWSVDDDIAWLDKTRKYLQASHLSTENLLTLKEFIVNSENEFDIILLDLNYVEVRKKYIKLVIDRCKPGGIILFDDVHKREFMTEVLLQTQDMPVKLYNITFVTKDQFGRFALLGLKS